jgi:hypothetical protein
MHRQATVYAKLAVRSTSQIQVEDQDAQVIACLLAHQSPTHLSS